VADIPPAPPQPPLARGSDHEVLLNWRYPKYQGAAGDLVVGFHVYRGRGATGPMQRLTGTPVLRNDAATGPLEFRDTEPANGVAYRYQLTAVDLVGRESEPTAPVTGLAVDRTPPGVATDLAVQNGDGTVVVSWRRAPEIDAAGYHLERSTGLSRPFTRLDRTLIPADQPIWTDTLPGGRQYFYRVIVVDSAGNVSIPSNAIAAFPVDHTPPAPPSAVTATVAQHHLSVHWAGSPSRDVRGYYVYRGEGADRLVRLTQLPIATTQFADSGYAGSGLTPGRTYLVRVSAVDSAFNESGKVETRVLVPDDRPPSPPTGFHLQDVRGRYVAVSWSASSALDVAAYVLTRGASDTAPAVTIRLPGDARAWNDTAVVHGRRYTYRLTATDSAGNVSAAVTDSMEFRDFTPPPPPRAASARVVGHAVEIRWERVVSRELVGYHVYRATLPTGLYRRLTTAPVAALVFTDSTGTAGLFYTVRAVDRSHNESSPSPVAEVIKP
jgi:fibronectin type 3 domain-containing protein